MNVETDGRFEEVLAAYLEAEGHGWQPDRERFIALYPRLADQLRQFFADQDRVDKVAQLLRPAMPNITPAPASVALERSGMPVHQAHLPRVPGYEVQEELARGGFGVVYRARQVEANRTVALKMILGGPRAGEGERRRFRREVEAAARLQHPGVVRIYEVGEHEGLPFFSMEYCAGGSLADRLDGTPLPPVPAARLVERLARAVQTAHDCSLVHRDLKPANVLLAREGNAAGDEPDLASPAFLEYWTPKLADFGLARDLEAPGHTASGTITGTPSYMAPEQAASHKQPVGPAADVYALGAILYELLTGRPPFRAPTSVETVLQVLHDEPVPVDELQPKCPRDLETICHKCLEKEPGRRYPTARDLALDLERFVSGKPVTARPVGSLERAWRWGLRNPVTALLLIAVLLTLAGAAGLAGFVAWQQTEHAGKQAALRAEAESAREATKAQLERARANLLTAQLARVDALYERDPARALELLRDPGACPVELRDAAWWYYKQACSGRRPATLTGHTDGVTCVCFRPDGKRLATAGGDGTVRLWDLAARQQLATFLGHTSTVYSVVFSPDGNTLASGSSDKTVKLWDVATGRERTLAGHTHYVDSVAFSPDGNTLASGSADFTVKLWDVAAGKERATLAGHSREVYCIAFSPDGTTLASGGRDNTVKLWDLATGTERLSLEGHTAPVLAVAFSPDGGLLASGSSDRTVTVWDATTGQEHASLQGHTFAVYSVAFSPNGKTLASGSSDETVKLWDVATGQERASLRGHTDRVASVAFSPDAVTLASGSADFTVKLWDIAPGHGHGSLEYDPLTEGVVKLGEVVGRRDEAAIRKAAEEVARFDLKESMGVFKPRARGGAGVGPKEGAYGVQDGIEAMVRFLAKKEENARAIVAKGADDVRALANITAGMAQVTELHTPTKREGEKGPGNWKAWTADMRNAATDLAAAAERKDATAVKAAAFKLNRSCNDCHIVFRDSGN